LDTLEKALSQSLGGACKGRHIVVILSYDVVTVLLQCQYNVSTGVSTVSAVSAQCQHSVSTVSAQCQHSVSTVSAQCQHSVSTVSA
jgi:hypothetical protein